MSLATLGLSPELLRATKEKGYSSATEIQKELIPAILTGRDILAGAQTGSGKTAGYALPLLQELSREHQEEKHIPKALILVPTRELAKQIYQSFLSYGKYLPLKTIVLYGGANITAQVNRLNAGIDIVIATSGRLLEHLNRKTISLDAIRYLVLDEADTTMDMGFIYEISQLLTHLPSKRQHILISATLTPALKRLSDEILHKPKRIEVDRMGATASSVKQILYPVMREKREELLSWLIGSRNYTQVMVFVRKKELADQLTLALNASGLQSQAIHGDKSSGARTRALERFKEGSIRVLVATDIAARGLDIPSMRVVINYDIPHVLGDYIHRIGRTGRAGTEGLAITLSTPEESIALKDLERLLGRAIPKEILPDYAPAKQHTVQKKSKAKTEIKKAAGAFGRKKNKTARTSKKRKTTKRDGWKR
jgi:ATP-dependent RNA helicase RhlE